MRKELWEEKRIQGSATTISNQSTPEEHVGDWMEGLNNETKDEDTLKSYKGLIIEAIPIANTTSIDANMNPSPTKNMPFTKKQIDLFYWIMGKSKVPSSSPCMWTIWITW